MVKKKFKLHPQRRILVPHRGSFKTFRRATPSFLLGGPPWGVLSPSRCIRNGFTSRGQTFFTLNRLSKSSFGHIRDHRVCLKISSDRRGKCLNVFSVVKYDFYSKMCHACSQQRLKSGFFFCDVCRVEVLLLPLTEYKFIVSFAL